MKEDQGVVKSKKELKMNKLDIQLSGNLFTRQRLATSFFFFSRYPWAIQKNPLSNRLQNNFNKSPPNQYHIDLLI